MSDGPELPPRPSPPRRLSDLVVPWLNWFGPGRIAAIVAMVAVVGVGAYWLVRAPVPPAEAGLPFAQSSSVQGGAPSSTLPPPMTVPEVAVEVPVVVHVAGAVVAAGVYRLSDDARVHAAIEAAGGATADADLDGLNLAAPLIDGQRVYVPVAGEVDPAVVPDLPPGPVGAGDASTGPIDLNRATASELDALPGVGPSTAAAIIDDRDRNGPFASVDELDRVTGIGPAKLEALRDLVTV